MQFSHEKHYYFFEKYLRNEMTDAERESFELKLSQDPEYLQRFEHYKANRQEIVEEELKEYEVEEILPKKPEKWGWVYTSISLLCIVLMVDYYISSSYDTTAHPEKKRRPLIEKINIFSPRPAASPKANNTRSNNSNPADTARNQDSDLKVAGERDSLEPWQDYIEVDRMGIQGDYFVSDSLFPLMDAEDILDKALKLKVQTDSLLDDSIVNLAAIRLYMKHADENANTLLVEFWDSPIHFNGYLFNGKKLLIYGVERENPIYLVYSAGKKYHHIFIRDKEFQLYPDQQFHKLAEE